MKGRIKSAAIVPVFLAACAFAMFACGCGEQPIKGDIYTLEQAYSRGWLDKDDLLSIAYYYHSELSYPHDGRAFNGGLIDGDYSPKQKAPATLKAHVQNSIKNDYAELQDDGRGVSADDVVILGYYGSYNGCYAVLLDLKDVNHGAPVSETEVGGVCFLDNGITVSVWKG